MRIVKSILVGLAIFFVTTVSYGLIRVTIQLYRIAQAEKAGVVPKELIGGWYTGEFNFVHNPYLWIALFVSVATGIWIMKMHGIPDAIKRLLFSTVIGFAFVAGLFAAGVLLGPPKGQIVIVTLLYWPSRLLVFGGLDCPNADSIAEKLTCAGMSLGISCLTYSAVAYILLLLIKKRPQRLGSGSPLSS